MQCSKPTSKLPVVLAGLLATLALALNAHAKRPMPVELAAGSHDGLAAAIASAGPGGTVIVKKGLHYESGTTLVTIPVHIVGENGAVIESGTSAITLPEIIASIRIKGTHDVTVQGLQFASAADVANTAILIEHSPDVQVLDNTMTDFQKGVMVQYGDRANIRGNTIVGTPNWPDLPGGVHGILVINGNTVRLTENRVSETTVAIFVSNYNGRADANNVSNSMIGFVICHWPQDGSLKIDGTAISSDAPTTGWHFRDNVATDNGAWGYLVIDGSHNNVLANNAASHNGTLGFGYDIELTGDSNRYFGFFTPASYHNVVTQGSHKSLTIKDCGNHNIVSRDAVLVDTSADPCWGVQ